MRAIDTVPRVLAGTGLPPHWLQLEITETMLVSDAPAMVTILER